MTAGPTATTGRPLFSVLSLTPAMRFVATVAALGAVALAASIGSATGVPTLGSVLAAAALVALGEMQFLQVRHGGQTNAFNWSEAALVAGLVLLPAWWLPPVGAAAVAVAQAVYVRHPMKVAFNATSYAVAAFLATAVHQHLDLLIPGAPEWAALAAACLVYFAWNNVTVLMVLAMSNDVSPRRMLASDLMIAVPVAVANSSLAIFVAILAGREPLVLLAVPPTLMQLLFSYRNTREVVRERDLWVAVQGASEQLQRASAEEVPTVALDAVMVLARAAAAELVLARGAQASRHHREGNETTSTVGSLASIADDVWGRVECDRSPFWLDAGTAAPRQRRWLDRTGTRSVLVIPLEWGGEMVGLLRVGFATKPTSTDRLQSVLLTVASQVASAITSHRQTQSLRHQAEHDELTGLPNRHRLVQHLEALLAEPAADGSSLAVLFFDLDGFKVVNDSLGHHVGDRLLLDAADRLRSRVRPADLVARFGGDEFIVVCPGLQHPTEAVETAERLLDALTAPVGDGEGIPISASVGVAVAEAGTDAGADTLLRDADAAMYQAKRNGAGSSCLFTAELRTQVLDRMHLEADLRDALRHDRLEVHYQPIVDLRTGEVRELEALARWHHPDRGSVPATAFIGIAEESGQIRALGAFVLNRACADMRRWLDRGLVPTGQRVAVNLSPMQLDASLPTVVAEALANHGLPPSALTLEVTESAFVDDPDGVAALERLRALGIHVALDDFGTGYSSLSALRDLPADAVKIDRSFIERVADDRQLAALVRGIVVLAHALGLEVVGEGVETAEQSSTLGSFGCDRAQGWLHGEPVGATAVETLLAEMLASGGEPEPSASDARNLRLA